MYVQKIKFDDDLMMSVLFAPMYYNTTLFKLYRYCHAIVTHTNE